MMNLDLYPYEIDNVQNSNLLITNIFYRNDFKYFITKSVIKI